MKTTRRVMKINHIDNQLTSFEKQGYRLQVYDNGRIYLYHPCTATSQVNNKSIRILLPHEVNENTCMFCGSLHIPGEIATLWHFLYKESNYVE